MIHHKENKIIAFIILLFLPIVYSSLFPTNVGAVCPVCTVAVAGGLGLSRWLGIDDAVSGIWVGGLLMSTTFWTVDWLKKKKFSFSKKINKKLLPLLVGIFWYAFTLIPLWMGDIVGHPLNTILGMDKIIFGTAVGSLIFLFGVWADRKVREVRGKQFFVYQKVVFPVVSLVIVSLLLYYYGGYLY